MLPGAPARWDSIYVQGGEREKINKGKHFWSLGSAQYSYHMYHKKINQNSIHWSSRLSSIPLFHLWPDLSFVFEERMDGTKLDIR